MVHNRGGCDHPVTASSKYKQKSGGCTRNRRSVQKDGYSKCLFYTAISTFAPRTASKSAALLFLSYSELPYFIRVRVVPPAT